jgi:hypothetical protein
VSNIELENMMGYELGRQEALRRITRISTQDNRDPGRDSKKLYPERNYGELPAV